MPEIRINGQVMGANVNIGSVQNFGKQVNHFGDAVVTFEDVVLGAKTKKKFHIVLRTDGLADFEYTFEAETDGRINSHFELAYYDANHAVSLQNMRYRTPVMKQWRVVSIKEIE